MQVGVAYSGKRVAQNSKKAKAITKREKRLNRIGLSLHSFRKGFEWAEYFNLRLLQRSYAVIETLASAHDGDGPVGNAEVPDSAEATV